MATKHLTRFLLAPEAEWIREMYPVSGGPLFIGPITPRDDSISGVLPTYAGDAGVDLPTAGRTVVPANGMVKLNLGVKAVCLRVGCDANKKGFATPWAFNLVARSSIAKTPLMLANSVGVIDAGYRGPLIAAVRNLSAEPYTIEHGIALFQIVAADLAVPSWEVLEPRDPLLEKYFAATARGSGGFGSTGAAGSAGAAAN